MNLSTLEIRPLQSIEELEIVKKLEERIWSIDDAVPVNQTAAAVKNGGLVLGAFIHMELVGFQYSFPGFNGKNIYLVSHSLGIHPDYRKYGIGEKLKWAQKKMALELGYELITWTYDPLETVNGYLNLHKLGAVCSTYIENAYGEMADNLNAGLPTDRFLVEWEIKRPCNKKTELIDIDQPLTISTSLQDQFLVPGKIDLGQNQGTVVIPVPGNFQEMKNCDFPLALKWRNVTRDVFSHYLRLGWVVTDLIKDSKQDHQYLYLLEKREK
ncbi:GNAT family N-acetyltransferase [Anaerobacillus sp. CMMVII]|uniref:GNAT family N-acetyltransferase n=1 Tax=Anaerobacillus sp. CMMVII TaxID=2755588 RepID=UPI0021B7656A|nr:GNAT family N-acetyltransferase [Anaerobacillus sp. CMMVII]